jgi:beta-lactamase regulating signal transducer with metallopeptidase domain
MTGGWVDSLNQWGVVWASAMVRASWQGAAALALAWVASRAWPRMPSPVRCWLWRLAYLKLLVAFLWITPVDLPLLPPASPASPAVAATGAPVSAPAAAVPEREVRAARSPAPTTLMPNAAGGLLLLWLLGVGGCIGRGIWEWRQMRRLRRASEPVRDQQVMAGFTELCRRMRLRVVPHLLAAPGSGSPLLLGVHRAVIILPASLVTGCSLSELRLMLGHELTHLRRRDLFWAWLPALSQGLFWFHPLVWLSAREWCLAQELACDQMAVRFSHAPPGDYGEILLKVAAQCRPRAAGGWGTVSVLESYQMLQRRLVAMKSIGDASSRRITWIGVMMVALGVAALVPWRVTAQTGGNSGEKEAGSAAQRWYRIARYRGHHADLKGAVLRSAPLASADLREAVLEGADLRGAQLQHAVLTGAQLGPLLVPLRPGVLRVGSVARAIVADLRDADLTGADLRNARLPGANLRQATLVSAALALTNLTDVDMQSARLVGADLRHANLHGADLRAADLQHADFRGANLTRVKLTGVHYDAHTRWPQGFDPRWHGAVRARALGPVGLLPWRVTALPYFSAGGPPVQAGPPIQGEPPVQSGPPVPGYGSAGGPPAQPYTTAGGNESRSERRFGFASVDGFFLLPFPAVQEDLNLTREQKAALDTGLKAWGRPSQAAAQLPPPARQGERQQVGAMARDRLVVRLEHLIRLTTVQQERLRQFVLQVNGGPALLREDVAPLLKLTPEQREKIARLLQENAVTDQFLVSKIEGPHVSPRQRDAALRLLPELRQGVYRAAVAVLAPEQRQRWQALIGPPADLKALIVKG